MKKTRIDKLIKKLYYKKKGFKLPFYLSIGKYRLCMYARDLDWSSLRIKIMKDVEIWKVIKKGKY